ncbi:Fe(3+) dicitrate transport protein FecA precursor [Pseudoalteromonas sp. P1-9]|uniref:TonB-dependent receptor family protein n=1 Tax=Pseudoalteromonas sp. P1-9 TaxID=1710354 RepID=UPI0006D5E3C6|nr:TonB-dependent receptor [Pseudoalteromonas sp. P1-9]KPV97662.1 Fe(3+) dicitrate transport protein FecA precursor [Pseudoalteromonas sp. P1-9]
MKKTLLALAIASCATSVVAKDNKANDIEHITIISHGDKLRTESGSATLVSEVELEKYEYDDIHRILAKVPGVNIREEDGYGLRPNIGFRGVTPERSKKVTILEDGVLIGPAPYSAPAAYYFPVTTRMTAVEVFKGPAAIKHGPQTVAGTLNMVTRQVPFEMTGGLDLATGTDGYQKAHGYFGTEVAKNLGVLVEGVRLQADGFKEIDNGGDSGFKKNDLLIKTKYLLDGQAFDQSFELKLSYADENSDETYLGLTDADFNANPYRRYAASQPANMDTEHTQIMFTHNLSNDIFSATTRVYRNDYERAWRKLGGLTSSNASLSAIMTNPELHEREYAVITGEQNSVLDGETSMFLVMGTNDREYYSQGIQIDADYEFSLGGLDHKLAFGVRYHEDEIERKHFSENYQMLDGYAEKTAADKVFTTTNIENTEALSVYIEDTVKLGNLTVSAGVRGEDMDMYYTDLADRDDWQRKSTQIWLPGVSGFYQVTENAGVLFGVHQGFVPSSPQQASDVKVEKSINYEFGGRFNDGATNIELVSFFNDYSNLKESCSQSSCGTQGDLDREFNGGEVNVYGLEAQLRQSYPISTQFDMPYSFTYTYTKSEFLESFESDFEQWGDISDGDSVQYLPEHQLNFEIGLAANNWETNLIVKYVSEMDEAAGDSGFKTESSVIVDVSASYDLGQYGRIYGKVDNLTDEAYIISRRPYGARPNKPRQFVIGYKYQF